MAILECEKCKKTKEINQMESSWCFDCDSHYKKVVRTSAIEARHALYRQFGKVCMFCRKNRRYNEYKINKGTGRLTETKPCIHCIEARKLKVCQSCGDKKDKKEFGTSVSCKACRKVSREVDFLSFYERIQCKKCDTRFPNEEMMPGSKECIYCAIRFADPEGIVTLAKMFKDDEHIAVKVTEYIEMACSA